MANDYGIGTNVGTLRTGELRGVHNGSTNGMLAYGLGSTDGPDSIVCMGRF